MTISIDETRPRLSGFTSFYETDIRGWMADRSARHGKAKIQAIGTAIIGLLFIPFGVALNGALNLHIEELDGRIPMIILLVWVVGVGWLAIWPLKRLHGEVKNYLLTKVCNFMGLAYDEGAQGFPFDSVRETGIFPSFHRKSVEDHIRGTEDGVNFELAEIILKRRQRTGRSTTYVEVYHGVVFSFTFPKQFNGKTLVSRDTGAIGNFFGKIGKPQRVHLEDPRFEKLFEVYSTDQIEARYLLTPTFMERIATLADLFGKKAVDMAFLDNRLIVSVRVTENQFEAGGLFKGMTDTSRIETLAKELCVVFDIVDTLNLTTQSRA